MPAASTARSFLATISSVSPISSRRSEWPTITYCTCSLASIVGLTSPVNAPCGLEVAVLRAEPDRDAVAFERGLHRTQRGERRAHDDFDVVVVLLVEPVRELLHHLDRLQVV